MPDGKGTSNSGHLLVYAGPSLTSTEEKPIDVILDSVFYAQLLAGNRYNWAILLSLIQRDILSES